MKARRANRYNVNYGRRTTAAASVIKAPPYHVLNGDRKKKGRKGNKQTRSPTKQRRKHDGRSRRRSIKRPTPTMEDSARRRVSARNAFQNDETIRRLLARGGWQRIHSHLRPPPETIPRQTSPTDVSRIPRSKPKAVSPFLSDSRDPALMRCPETEVKMIRHSCFMRVTSCPTANTFYGA